MRNIVYKIFLFLIFILFLLLGLNCVSQKSKVFINLSKTSINPAIHYGVLPNGFQYVLQKNLTPAKKVEIHLNVLAGSIHETDDEQGAAHYLEHMLFNGSKHFKPGELVEHLQSLGMDYGVDANAHTSFFNTIYDLSLPLGDKKYIDDAFVILHDYASSALLLEEEVQREKGIILSEKRERDSIEYRTFKKTLQFELHDSRINKRFPIGIESVLKKIDRKTLKLFYDKWYRPDNMVLIMLGDFDINLVEAAIIKKFSDLKPRILSFPKSFDNKFKAHKNIKAFYHYEPEAINTEIAIENVVWTPFEQETLESIKSKTLNNLAFSILENRLLRMINQQTSDLTKASVFSGVFLNNFFGSSINAHCKPDKWEKSLIKIENVLRQGILYGFSQKELDRVKADYISFFEKKANQIKTKKSSQIAKQILRTINTKGLLLSDIQKRDILNPYIESVSLQDVNMAFKKAWETDHRLIIVTGNAKLNNIDDKEPEKLILDVHNKGSKKKISKYKSFKSKQFPYLKLPSKKSKIKSIKEIKDLGITKIQFENNLRVSLKQTDFKQNQFRFNLIFGDGKKSNGWKKGLNIISERVVNKSGFGKLDYDQLQEALSGKQVNILFGINENYFSFSGLAESKDLELVFQLLYHYLKDPGFQKSALNLSKIKYKQEYEKLMRSCDGLIAVKGKSFLAGNNPKFELPEPNIVANYNLTHIKKWLMPYFLDSIKEISIVGDFDKKKFIDLAIKYFGSFEKSQKYYQNLSNEKIVFPKGKTLKLEADTKIKTGIIKLSFLTDDYWNINENRRLVILSRVLSERIRVLIREKFGKTYSAYVYNSPSKAFKDYGILSLIINADSDSFEFIYEKVKEMIKSVLIEGITQKETTLSLKPVLTHLKVLRKTNKYWLNSVLTNSFVYPEKLLWARNIIKDYNSINKEDLTFLAKKYLDMNKSALITAQPKK